jgi:alpha-tubulin suppressor-like RCC1 family protein
MVLGLGSQWAIRIGQYTKSIVTRFYGNLNQPWLDFNAGYQNTFVIAPNGALWGSGGNDLGQLGVGTVQVQYNSPVQVSPGTSWRSVHSTAHTLAIQSNGSLWGWGQNNSGEMGNGTCCNNQLSPVQIGTATDWKQVQTSLTGASLALKQNGTLWGWGGNAGRLVSTPSNLVINYPTQIGTDTDWAYLSVGASHALGLKQDGSLWSWGSNPQGANGTGSSSNVPQRIGTDTWLYIFSVFSIHWA